MFKFKQLLSILLTLVVGLSLLMTYFILYDIDGFQSLVGIQEERLEVATPTPNQNQTRDNLDTTELSLQNVIAPDRMYLRLGQQSYYIHDQAIFSTINSLIESRPIVVNNDVQEFDMGTYLYLFDVDHLQIVLPERLPIGIYTRLLAIGEDVASDIDFDRIIIPLVSQESREAYLVDTETNSYLVGELSPNLSIEDFRNVLTRDNTEFIEVIRYQGFHSPIYLTVDSHVLDSRLFTAEIVPENRYVNTIFTDNNYTPSEVRDGLFRFQNYQFTLEINRNEQWLSLAVNRVTQGEPRTEVEKLRNSYRSIQNYEYWDEAIRLDRYRNNFVTFRRYFNGRPIITSSDVIDYGATVVQMRSDLSGDIYRYQQPMLVTNVFIDNITQEYPIESHQEILNILDEYNYDIGIFTDIILAYEWEEDMENFKKIRLVPKWFFEMNGEYYSIDEIPGEDFRQDWEAFQSYLNTNGRNE